MVAFGPSITGGDMARRYLLSVVATAVGFAVMPMALAAHAASAAATIT